MFVVSQLASDGYAIIEGFLTENEIEEIQKEIDKLVQNMPDQEHRTVFSTIDSESQQARQ